jgi:hypothetical protein
MSKQKLSGSMVWLFALGSVAAAIGASYATTGLGQKVSAAVYFAIVAIGGFGSTYLTKARVRAAVGAFLLTGAAAAIAYFFLVNHIVASTTVAMTDAVSGGQGHQAGVQAGATFGKFFGIIVAAVVFLETIVAGITGAVIGGKSRDKSGLAAVSAMTRAAS